MPNRDFASQRLESAGTVHPQFGSQDSHARNDDGVSNEARSAHWLVGVVSRAGLPGASDLAIAADAKANDAWDTVSTVCGVDYEEIASLVADDFGLEVADLENAEPAAMRLVPGSVARKFNVFPLREDYKTLVIATSNPNDLDMEQAVGFASGRDPFMEIASPNALESAIEVGYSPDRAVEQLLRNVAPQSEHLVRLVEEAEAETLAESELGSGPVVNLTNLVLREAVAQKASDVHMQPSAGGASVRFRVDGVLRHYMHMPLPALNRVVSRIKVMGKLDIADHLRPQDGKAKIGVGGTSLDLRISTVPTRGCEKAVVRLLRPQETEGLHDLRMPGPELQTFRKLLSNREGIVLVTGPTGSGKTTTLYAALKHLATDEINIMTVEDPVEYELPGLTQIQVEPKQGVTFASALRAILRQDPDVIFVGEIRDTETAEVAVHASMTGHLVLATLHTNDALATVQRLSDLKLERSTIAETLRGGLAQRLVRRVCPHCVERIDDDLNDEEIRLRDQFRITPPVRARGCDECGKTGFLGRAPLVEAFAMSQELASLIVRGAERSELQAAAVGLGMRPLKEVGKELAVSGETSLAELERVLGEAVDVSQDREHKPVLSDRSPAETEQQQPDAEEAEASVSPGLAGDRDTNHEAQPVALVVDDDGATRTVVRALLENEGYSVDEAADGDEALARFDDGGVFSFMVLDLDMPTVGGREVLTEVRSAVQTAGLPVIVLTGLKDPETELELMEQGADDYVRKPVDPARLLVRVKAMLRRAGT